MGAKLLELRPLNNNYRIDVDIIVNGASQSLRAPFTFITNTNSKLFNQMEKKKITNNNQTYANMNQKTNSNLCMNLKSDAKVRGFSVDSK
jgi:hypothetical protein